MLVLKQNGEVVGRNLLEDREWPRRERVLLHLANHFIAALFAERFAQHAADHASDIAESQAMAMMEKTPRVSSNRR